MGGYRVLCIEGGEVGIVTALRGGAGLTLQGMGVAFSSAAAGIQDDDLVLCSENACKCLHTVFMLPRIPSTLGVYETMVT